jgi:integrase
MSRQSTDGLSKRCDCTRRNWTKCPHPWHFDFYKGRKYRFSLHKLAGKPPDYVMGKTEAESLRDHYRSQIRAGTFRDPNHPEELPVDARLTFGDIADRYLDRYVRTPTRRKSAIKTFEWHIGVLKRAPIPAAHGQTIQLADKPWPPTKADIEAVRDWRRQVVRDSVEARAQWLREKAEKAKRGETIDRPMPRIAPGDKGGEVGINRLLARLRHLCNWAIMEGYSDATPFKRGHLSVVKLETSVETPRSRRLADEEETRLLQYASPHLQALIIAALSTGCRLGELLGLTWGDVEYAHDGKQDVPRSLHLAAGKTKTNQTRRVPVGSRLRAVLEMRRHGPNGKPFPAASFVFGNEAGERIASIKTAWRGACRRAALADLHFHDLKRTFGSRLLESGAQHHVVRDFLAHANIKTTSRYLATTPLALEHALHQLEAQRATSSSDLVSQSRPKDSHTTVTSASSATSESDRLDGVEVEQ